MWLYEGKPSTLSSNVGDANAVCGGYVLVLLMENQDVKLLATRFPARYLSSCASTIKRFCGDGLRTVLVTKPNIFYERIKRSVVLQIKKIECDDQKKISYTEVKNLLSKLFVETEQNKL